MINKIKNFLSGIGWIGLWIGFVIVAGMIFALLIIGGAKLFELTYPILEKISIFTWSIVWLLVILSIVPRFRKFTGTGIVLGTYIGGIILWFLGFYITYSLWGVLGILIGVLFLGLGVYFTAILALLFNKQFSQALFFIFSLLLIFLVRRLGFWILTKYKTKENVTLATECSSEKYVAIPARKLFKKPLSLGIVFLSIFLFIMGAVELFIFLKNPVLNMRIVWGSLEIISGVGLLLQKFWAYRLVQALFLINLIATPLYLVFPIIEFSFKANLILVIVNILVSGTTLWYLSRKNTKEQFLEPIFANEVEKQKLPSKNL